jgi:Flp pilus assembly protein TadD
MFLEIMDRQDEAGRYFARAAELDPENADFAANATMKTDAAIQTPAAGFGRQTVAVAVAETNSSDAGGETSEADLAMAAAAQLLRSGQADAALRQAADAAARYPNHPGLKRIKGAAQLKLGDPKSAQVTLQQALSLDSRNALTYFLLGCTLVEQGDSKAARKQFQTAHDLDPRYPAQPEGASRPE